MRFEPAWGHMDKARATNAQSNSSRVRDVLTDPGELWQLVRDSGSAWIDDFAPSMGAAISYYTVFSIAPLLLIVIAVAGLVLGQESATGQIFAQLQGLLGSEGATAVESMVESASLSGKGFLATVVGVVTLIIGATTVFAELQSSLDRIWESPAARNNEAIWTLLRTRLLSFGMILAIGFLLLISLVVSAALSALGAWWAPLFGGWEIFLQAVNFVISLVVVTVLFALIYKVLPRTKIRWHDVWIGAGATALLFALGKFLIGLYIGRSSVASGFGAAGSLVVLLVWVYYSAQIFLLGAEFTWVYARRYGSRRGDERAHEPTPERTAEKRSASAASEARLPASAASLAEMPAAPLRLQHPLGRGIVRAATAMISAGLVGWMVGKLTDGERRTKARRERWRRWRPARS